MRTSPLRVVCSTRRSGSTARFIGSPGVSSSVTFWNRDAGGGSEPDWATAADVGTSPPTSVAKQTGMVARRMGHRLLRGIVPLPEPTGRVQLRLTAQTLCRTSRGNAALALLFRRLYGRRSRRYLRIARRRRDGGIARIEQ